jgi:hypothetical protein
MYKVLKKMVFLAFFFYLIPFSSSMLRTPSVLAGECPESMVSYWRLDDTTQPYQDYLSSHSGSCSVNCPTSVAGKIGNAQFFNGTDTAINVAAAPAFNWSAGGSFSIEFWLQRDAADFSSFEILIGRDGGQSSSLQWWAGINSAGKAEFSLIDQNGNGPVGPVVGQTSLLDNNWHHVVLVRDGVSKQTLLYTDGALDSQPQNFTYPAGFQSATAPINIGWLQNGNFNYGGKIDEIAIYNRALSDFEIWQHHIDGSQGLGLGYCYDGTPIRIMPLGDSITRGTSTTITDGNYITGFRQKLFRTLQGYGYSVDFVGGGQTGSLAFPPFDPDHEGHPGQTDKQVADNVYSWLAVHPADVVLLHIGTNEVNANPGDVEFLLDEIDRYSEDITVLLARIINRQTLSTTTTIFNDNIESMAMTRIADGDKIIMVDQEGALLYPYDITNDNLHPTAGGYEKMADAWFAALEGVLPITNTLPVLTFPDEVMKFKMIRGQYPLTQSGTLDTLDGVPAGFTITSGASWLDVTTSGGTTPANVTFSINDSTLPVGFYSTYVTVSSPGYVDAVIEVKLVVVTSNSNYQLFVSSMPDHSGSVSLQNANLTGEVYVFTSPDTNVSRVSFYLDHELYRVENLAPFDFSGGSPYNTIQLTNTEHEITAIVRRPDGQSDVISSSFTVNSSRPALTFNTGSIAFASEGGSLPSSQVINTGSSDSIATNFSVFTNVDWLSLSPATGTTPSALTVSVIDSTLAPGIYNATITAVSDGYTYATVAVNYNVTSSGGNDYNLLLSSSPDRTAATGLNGTTVSGDIYVFTSPDSGVSSVVFSLDGKVVKTEGLAPFDFAGSGVGVAFPYSTNKLANGQHEISALINLTGGGSEVVSSTFTVDNVTGGSSYNLFVSASPDRSNAVNLGGVTVSGEIYVFTGPDSGVSSVIFSLDGAVVRTEGLVPFDFAGTGVGVAFPYDTGKLTDGQHEISALINLTGGGSEVVSSTFTVNNVTGGSSYNLFVSASPDRSNAVNLGGVTVSGEIYVFTGPDSGVSSVIFSLDGAVVRTEGLVPFDFAGTGVGVAFPYDTGQLADGQHEISALINLTGGGSELISNVFLVSN